MANFTKWLPGWATPLVPAFDFASLAARLGQVGSSACLARKQGKCEGRELCADCAWSESSPGESR